MKGIDMSFVILSDFDGTVVDIDTCVFILNKFAKAEWRKFDDQYEKGEITLEECLQKQFSTVRATETKILEEIEQVTSFRQNFKKLLEYCRAYKFPLILVSAGLDFVIRHLLKLKNWNSLVKVYAPKAECTVNGIKVSFPQLFYNTSVSFKDDLVRFYRKQDKKVVYIGDGLADYHAARNADFSFAIKGSKLAELLKRDKISYKEICDFQEVIETITATLTA